MVYAIPFRTPGSASWMSPTSGLSFGGHEGHLCVSGRYRYSRPALIRVSEVSISLIRAAQGGMWIYYLHILHFPFLCGPEIGCQDRVMIAWHASIAQVLQTTVVPAHFPSPLYGIPNLPKPLNLQVTPRNRIRRMSSRCVGCFGKRCCLV